MRSGRVVRRSATKLKTSGDAGSIERFHNIFQYQFKTIIIKNNRQNQSEIKNTYKCIKANTRTTFTVYAAHNIPPTKMQIS